MPLPVSTAFLIGAVSLSNLHGLVNHILVWTLVALALGNEVLRAIITRKPVAPAPRAPAREYEIPGAPRTIPNPLLVPSEEDA